MAFFKSLLRGFAGGFFFIICLAEVHSNPAEEIPVRGEAKTDRTVFVVHDAWHAAIVIKKADIPAAVLPELKDFPSAEYVEFSWGDRDYFPAPEASLGLALKAAFWSSGSILHVVGFQNTIKNVYPGAEIIEIPVTEEAFHRLSKFIADTFSRAHPSTAADSRPGLFPNGRFYPAEGKFSLLRTCNTWVAEALSTAGLAITPGYVITAGSLGNQLRSITARN